MIKNMEKLGINTTLVAIVGLILISTTPLLLAVSINFGFMLYMYFILPTIVTVISAPAVAFGIIAKKHVSPYANLGLFLGILDLIFLAQFIIGSWFVYAHLFSPP